MKMFVWIAALAESTVVLAHVGILPKEWNPRLLTWLTTAGSSSTPLMRDGQGSIATNLPLSLIAGNFLAIAGTGLRLSAYRALGRHFTYQLTVSDDHHLVTSFPYNIVRHPGYTGYLTCFLGVGLCLFTSDGWLRRVVLPSARNPTSIMRGIALGWILTTCVTHSLGTFCIFPRVSAEDSMLRERFGMKWDRWAKQVPYKLLPMIW
jgi:protein-S-isoprenylcysteine O-methyltransferase Ste14